jgi:hypothetical protein
MIPMLTLVVVLELTGHKVSVSALSPKHCVMPDIPTGTIAAQS